jgi:predicted RecB family endonuclease
MNADIIYKVFETAVKHGGSIAIAAEILRGHGEITDLDTKKDILGFISLHFDDLYRAYNTGNKKLFADIVRVCINNNKEEIDMLQRAYATGNEKLIAEMEAKYGGEANV